MSTTDTRAAFEAYVEREENLSLKIYDLPHKPYQSSTTQRAFAAFEAGIVYAATEAAKAAAQDSAPVELLPHIKTWRDRRSDHAGALTTADCLALADREIADLRAALAAAPSSPQPAIVKADTPEYTQYECYHCGSGCTVHKLQPVAKVLTDTQEAAFELAAKTIELFDDKTMENDYMLDSSECAGIIRALKPSAIAALAAASTPTTLTEKKE